MGFKKRTSAAAAADDASPCAHLRAAYNSCFNRWYSEKFTKGQWDKEECVSEWDKYRACLVQHLEDKHLSRLLLEDSFVYSSKDDTARSENVDDVSGDLQCGVVHLNDPQTIQPSLSIGFSPL